VSRHSLEQEQFDGCDPVHGGKELAGFQLQWTKTEASQHRSAQRWRRRIADRVTLDRLVGSRMIFTEQTPEHLASALLFFLSAHVNATQPLHMLTLFRKHKGKQISLIVSLMMPRSPEFTR
jgi:hypothetical protein